VRHQNGCNLSFTDGHVNGLCWVEPNTMLTSEPQLWLIIQPAIADEDRDLVRLMRAVPQFPAR
jgi:prepilin-type processing-associated H-X9-DG protein